MEKIALIGVGNIMFYDEGVGTYLTKYIEANYNIPDNLEIVDGSLLGFGLMSYYQEFDKILVVTTTSEEKSVGEIVKYSAQEMASLSQIRKTANEVEISMMVDICSIKEDIAEIEFLTIAPENIIDVKNGLSDTIKKRLSILLEETLNILQRYGLELSSNGNIKSFDEVIEEVANPKNIRF
ncbi:MAG TPA: hydrogenase maturation protease [Nitratifractor sp.]|nr:hydrogenase maturation protease [Nitratifractor sp.]HHH20300.1 hydrogenase maturation protease [Nitratifractor sp.]